MSSLPQMLKATLKVWLRYEYVIFTSILVKKKACAIQYRQECHFGLCNHIFHLIVSVFYSLLPPFPLGVQQTRSQGTDSEQAPSRLRYTEHTSIASVFSSSQYTAPPFTAFSQVYSKAPLSYDPPSSDLTSPAPSIFAYSTPKHHSSRHPLGVERPMSPLMERPMSPFFARTQLQIAVKSGSEALSAVTSTPSAVGSRPHCPTAKVAPLGTSGDKSKSTAEPRVDQLQASVDLGEKERIRKLTETLGQFGISPSRSDSRLGSESGWKGVLEMKDRILNQKSQLIERFEYIFTMAIAV